MFLHAWRARLAHPVSGVPLQLEAPLPQECASWLEAQAARRPERAIDGPRGAA
jgi:23S rRNA pseudouridine955/2504/2580 synthase